MLTSILKAKSKGHTGCHPSLTTRDYRIIRTFLLLMLSYFRSIERITSMTYEKNVIRYLNHEQTVRRLKLCTVRINIMDSDRLNH